MLGLITLRVNRVYLDTGMGVVCYFAISGMSEFNNVRFSVLQNANMVIP